MVRRVFIVNEARAERLVCFFEIAKMFDAAKTVKFEEKCVLFIGDRHILGIFVLV